MSSKTPTLSQRAEARAAGKARRAKAAREREAFFDLLVSGYSHEQIAARTGVSVASVRRAVERAIAQRRLDGSERYVHLQITRLTKALRLADEAIDEGKLNAIDPFLRVVAALDRYHRLAAAAPLPSASSAARIAREDPLALTHAVSPELIPPVLADVTENGAQLLEIAGAPPVLEPA
jgi:hypothetical protein